MATIPRVVFRIGKLKSWGEVGAALAHNLRTRPTPNAGAGGFVELVSLTAAPADAVRTKIGKQKIRSNAVLAVEVVISASPEFFRPDCPELAGYSDPKRLASWREAMEPWITANFPNAVSVVLHLDESSPHYQIIDIPLDEKGKLNCRGKYGGKETLIAWQDRAAEPVTQLGIQRGIAGSTASHEQVATFYAAVNTPTPVLPKVTTRRPQPLPPRTLVEQVPLSDAKLKRDELEQQVAAQRKQRDAEKQAQTEALRTTWPAVSKKAKAVDIEQKRRREAEATAEKAQRMKADADKLRTLPIDQVLRRVYGAELEKGSKDAHASKKFVLADGRKIAVSKGRDSADVWIEQGEIGKRGAINLLMHLDGIDYKGAVRLLAEHFAPGAITTEHARVLADRAASDVAKISKNPVPAPPPDPAMWRQVRAWLKDVRGMPRKVIDYLHGLELLYADSRANAVFKRVNGGAFQRGTGNVKFHRAIGGAECGPFVIPGDGKRVIIVEAPLDAVAVWATDPTATVIASGGDMIPPKNLSEWIAQGAEVLAAHDADPRGEQLAEATKSAFGAERKKPTEKDWAETVRREPWRVDSAMADPEPAQKLKTPPRPSNGPQ